MNRRALGVALLGGAATLTAAALLRKPAPMMAPVAAPVSESVTLQPLDWPDGLAKMVPGFGFTDEDGRPHTLAEHRGRVVILNLWATWCAPCVAELPALAALAHAEPGMTVLPLSTDRGGAATVRRFFEGHALDLPVWVDPQGESGRVLGLRGLPTTLLLDPQGRERARLEGAFDWASEAARAKLRSLAS